MVYYLKYRPKRIEELDLKGVRKRISSILSGSDIPHAFLFSGPRGLGKTSSARILAREVHGKKLDEDTFEQIASGSHPDVLEIDAASNRGIDEIRELRARVGYSPMSLPKKVYIIDEVHMLTREAFNALLKTLEEPPEHVIFVLATTEPWKLPETVMSRVFHVQFGQPSHEEVVASLSRIVEGEKLDVEEGVLDGIAELADGAFRDGAKILEELSIASSGGKISKKLLEETFRTAALGSDVDDLLRSMAKRDVEDGMKIVGRIASSGIDMRLVVARILERIYKGLSGEKMDFSQEELLRLSEVFTTCYQQMKDSPVSELPLQVAVVKWGLKNKNSGSNFEGEEEKLSGKTKEEKGKNDSERTQEKVSRKPESKNREESEGKNQKHNLLQRIISEIDQENKMLAGVLRGVSLGKQDEKSVEFVTRSKFHKEKIEEKKARALVEKKIKDTAGKKLSLTVTMEK